LTDSGAAALEAVERAHRNGQVFRLVLLDYHMPGMNGVQFAERLQSLPDWKPCPMILLSSSVSGLDSERLKSVGINRFMPKPVIASELLPAMLDQFGVAAVGASTRRDEFPAFQPRRILLAEDNPVNQKVVLGFLHKWGQQIVVASDGRQAVQAVEREPFDLVLMDVQMPEMDGYEATAAIRVWERKTGHHIPIVAMTAEAMKGDRELCLEAGMDDYLTKPIDTAALYKLIAKYPAHVLTEATTPAAANRQATPSAASGASASGPGGAA
jgi:CheY-like chemotaxis protein